jgi:hypothetical protein
VTGRDDWDDPEEQQKRDEQIRRIPTVTSMHMCVKPWKEWKNSCDLITFAYWQVEKIEMNSALIEEGEKARVRSSAENEVTLKNVILLHEPHVQKH